MNYAGIDNMNNYTGYTYDEVMEIYFAQARFYDPVDTRFIQEDPVKDGSNWYAYCGGNPITWVDPMGLRQEQDRFVPLRAIVEKFGGQVTSYKKSTIAAAGTRYKGARHTATVSLGGQTKTAMERNKALHNKFIAVQRGIPPNPIYHSRIHTWVR